MQIEAGRGPDAVAAIFDGYRALDGTYDELVEVGRRDAPARADGREPARRT